MTALQNWVMMGRPAAIAADFALAAPAARVATRSARDDWVGLVAEQKNSSELD